MNTTANTTVTATTTSAPAADAFQPNHLFVANLKSVSLEKLVRSKLEVLFDEQQDTSVEMNGLYDVVLEQVEKPLIELALKVHRGNQVKTAKMLGINRNTLKKKMDGYKIKVRSLT